MHEKGGSGRLPRSGRGAVGGGGYKLFINTASLSPHTFLTSHPLPPSPRYDSNWASNWPLRGTKGTLLDGGVRGVGVVSGGAIAAARHGTTLDGFVHLADLFPTILTYAVRGQQAQQAFGAFTGVDGTAANAVANAAASATANVGGERKQAATWLDVVHKADEPPFELGDGQDLYDYIVSGTVSVSPRTEVLHEAHPVGSTDGIGNALRVGDWKVVLRTGVAWPQAGSTGAATNGGADGWFGGIGSSDPATDGYILPLGTKTQPWTVTCAPPPLNTTAGFACEQIQGAGADGADHACLFNMRDDPCETVDRSKSEPEILSKLMLRLEAFRHTAVYGPDATRNPDGKGCPEIRNIAGCEGGGAKPPMSCAAKLPCGDHMVGVGVGP